MTAKRFVLMSLGLLLVFALVGGYLGFLMVLPKNPKEAYFPEKESRLGGVRWTFGTFQPVFLGAKKDSEGKTYLKTVYRDANNKVRFVEVWPVNDEKVKELKFGKRFSVSYVRNVISRPADGDFYAEVRTFSRDDAYLYKLCDSHGYMCDLAEYTLKNGESYWNFRSLGYLPQGVKLMAVEVGLEPSL